jgi:type VI secretion system protein VasG
VPFFTLDPKFMKEIVVLKMNKLAARLAESNRMRLSYSPEVVDQITARCTEVETGARNIDHIMRGTILPQMSREILARLSDGSMPSEVSLGLAEDGAFKIEFGG